MLRLSGVAPVVAPTWFGEHLNKHTLSLIGNVIRGYFTTMRPWTSVKLSGNRQILAGSRTLVEAYFQAEGRLFLKRAILYSSIHQLQKMFCLSKWSTKREDILCTSSHHECLTMKRTINIVLLQIHIKRRCNPCVAIDFSIRASNFNVKSDDVTKWVECDL